jgi:predicted DNA-binding ribbon-helix-helix protein
MKDVAIRKRSVLVAGHATSVSLEPEFWDELRRIAAARGLSLSALIAEIDARRGPRNLSSALRVHVLIAVRQLRPAPEKG